MKIDGATIAIEPRSIGECIDLAVRFTGTYWRPIARLTAWFAGPACLATYWIAGHVDSGLWIGLFLFYVMTPFLGAAIVAGAGHRTFGDPFTVRDTFRILFARPVRLAFYLLQVRLLTVMAAIACFVPAILPAVYWGFFPEILLLEESRGGRLFGRSADLMRGVFIDLAARYLLIIAFSLCVAATLFTMLDLVARVGLGMPILSERISTDFLVDELPALMVHDPKVVTLFCASLWLVYPVARLAWFICYLDNRIRKEAWDVELEFRIEAERILPQEDAAA